MRRVFQWAVESSIVVLFAIALHAFVESVDFGLYTIPGKVQHSLDLTNPIRTALSIACSENALRESMASDDLGLAPLGEYESPDSSGLALEVVSPTLAKLTLSYESIGGSTLAAGTLVLVGRCELTAMPVLESRLKRLYLRPSTCLIFDLVLVWNIVPEFTNDGSGGN